MLLLGLIIGMIAQAVLHRLAWRARHVRRSSMLGIGLVVGALIVFVLARGVTPAG